MKKNVLILFAVLSVGIFYSCEKDKDAPPEPVEDKSIKITELTDYYIAGISQDELSVIYFTSEEGKVYAHFHGLGRYGKIAVGADNFADNQLTLNIQRLDYKFLFAKGKPGGIVLESYSVPYEGESGLYKVADAPEFQSTTNQGIGYEYKSSNTTVSMYFKTLSSGTVWGVSYTGSGGFPVEAPNYLLGNKVGWKSGDDSTLGVIVPDWKGSGPVMLIQTDNINLIDGKVHLAKRK